MQSKFSSKSKILLAAVPVNGLGWISVEGFVVSCVKSWFINCTGSISIGSSGLRARACVVPPGEVITSVSGSLVIADAVRVCVCKSSFLALINCGRRNNKITNKQKRSSLLAVLATCIGQNKNSYLK